MLSITLLNSNAFAIIEQHRTGFVINFDNLKQLQSQQRPMG
jgi:hypothetical protein